MPLSRLNLARSALRPSVASTRSRGPFAAPVHPTTRGVPAPRPRSTVRRLNARSGATLAVRRHVFSRLSAIVHLLMARFGGYFVVEGTVHPGNAPIV